MYNRGLYNLSQLKLTGTQKELIYAPYLKNLVETMDYVKEFDGSFSDGFSFLKFRRGIDIGWLLFSFLRGNFMRYRG
jgi:hypothetical protein